MDAFLLETFHNIITGDLNPFMNKNRDFNKLLSGQVESGAKLLSYNHTYFTEDHIEYVNANSYWFKGLHDIYPMYSKHQISKEKYPNLLTRVNNLPADRKVLTTLQYYPGQIELVLEVCHEHLTSEEARFYYYNLLLYQEYRKVIDTLNKKLSNEDTLSEYIKSIQSLLEQYLQTIDNNYNPSGSFEWHLLIDQEFTEQDIFKLMKQYLQGMVHHLYSNYRQYLNLDHKAYYFLHRITVKYKSKEINYIYEALGEHAVDDMLSDIIQGFISSFTSRECSIPLSSLGKFEVLVDRLHDILEKNKELPGANTSELIADALFMEGFNSPQFIHYLIRQNESTIQHLNREECREYLKERIKKYKKLLATDENIYNPKYIAVGDAMMSWCRKRASICKSDEQPESAAN
ncbi:hypothetical protein JMN32_14975 [Fulvivirga sp. 29W222]|uniref:Uncharacterized protein n=1 Tax=Fulvivirga marina TaxID=2494733 RepID=A0A937KCP8_9BACT|nr:hypothetical protein [Fulvivirga marina]MBL6447619.1 hypothetical protein [Fulvivirga marina]